ncbi:MAG: soxA [Proteobacteria bacterium]|jgi:L-cysteine S-thiosulfotransferase|nr:soxA [Pseudomonadota bacterium]
MRAWAWACALLALLGSAAVAEPLPDGRRSGLEFMGESTQAMQRDDALNPGMLWVLEGEAVWSQPVGADGRSCAGCHGAARQAMRGVAARYPAFDTALQRPIDLRQRIASCRQKLQPQAITPGDAPQALALEAYVAFQSRGLPITPPADPRLEPARDRGRRLFHQRLGQLDLACSDCHEAHAGRRLGGSPIPQAHPTGYPIYRLEWQGLGSLQRRLRACLSGVRAEPFAWGAAEWLELELFLAWRARGMPLESPAVRP